MLIETTDYKGLKVEIHTDEDPENPRHWSNLGKMYCFARDYNLGDKHDLKRENFDSYEDIKQHLIKLGASIIFPLYAYIHSGITIRTYPFNDSWDSGQVGWIVAFDKDIEEECGFKTPLTFNQTQTIQNVLTAEVETYDQYLRGDVYGYTIIKPSRCKRCGKDNSETLDSCWGFYGIETVREESMSSAKSFAQEK